MMIRTLRSARDHSTCCRHQHRERKLRLESLESRAMLAATPFAPDWVADLPSPTGSMSIRDSAVDADGNLVVIGRFSGTVNFDPSNLAPPLTAELYSDVFVAKYNSLGAFVKAVDFGDIPLYDSESLTVDGSGNVYVAVEYIDQAILMNGQVVPDPGVYAGTIIVKLNSSLQFGWASIATLDASGGFSDGEVRTTDIAVDSAGTSLYFGGIMVGKGAFGNINLRVGYDGFVSRMNAATGAFQWAKSLRGIGTIANVAVDPVNANAVYARTTANAVYDSQVLRLDGIGNTVWQKVIGNNIGWSDMAARNGGLFLAGWFSGQASIDQTTLLSAGKTDALAVRFHTATGNVNWAVRAGATEDERAERIAIDADGNLFLAGSFDGIAVFGADTLAESSSFDSFISQLDAGNGAFLQSWRYGPATVVDLAATTDHAYAVGTYSLPGSDFPNGSFFSTAEVPSYLMHFAPAADATRPRINGFIASPDPVEQGDPLTLSVVGLYDPATISRVGNVAFYYDDNANRRLDLSDTLLDVDMNGTDGWSTVTSTATLPFGDQVFLAQATYDGNLKTFVVSATSEVKQPVDPTAQTYVSNDVPKPTRDLKTVKSIITVTDSFVISDVDVRLDISHHNEPDVYLVSPAGTRVELFTDVGGNFTNTILNDEALDSNGQPISIGAGSSPFTGEFRPEGLLTNQGLHLFDGQNAKGTWTLEVYDDTKSQYGGIWGDQLNAWSLTISAAASAATSSALIDAVAIDAALAQDRVYRPIPRPTITPPNVVPAETALLLNAIHSPTTAAIDAILTTWDLPFEKRAATSRRLTSFESLEDSPFGNGGDPLLESILQS